MKNYFPTVIANKWICGDTTMDKALRSFTALIMLASITLAQNASAVTINLVYEFDGMEPVQTYATVDITQNGADLDFAINYVDYLGASADIHEFYFNLTSPPDPVTSLAITVDNHTTDPYTVIGSNPSIAGGAGSSFDWGVNLGNGSANGNLQTATFTLSADQALSVSDLFETSFPNNTPPVNVAVHFQSTVTSPGSETIGGVVPVPAAVWLFGTGLLGLIGVARRKKAA
jgi:hypothetical protein